MFLQQFKPTVSYPVPSSRGSQFMMIAFAAAFYYA